MEIAMRMFSGVSDLSLAQRPNAGKQIADINIRRRLYGRYSQTADQRAHGPAWARRITGESLDFGPSAERYSNVNGQYLLDLPPAKTTKAS